MVAASNSVKNSSDVWDSGNSQLQNDTVAHYTSKNGDFVVFSRSVDANGNVQLTQIVSDDSGKIIGYFDMLPNGQGSVPVYKDSSGNIVEFDYLYETSKGDLLAYTGEVGDAAPAPPQEGSDTESGSDWISVGTSKGTADGTEASDPLPKDAVFSTSKSGGSSGSKLQIYVNQDATHTLTADSVKINGQDVKTSDISPMGSEGGVLVPVTWGNVSLENNTDYKLPLDESGKPYDHYVVQSTSQGSQLFGLQADENGHLTSVYLGSYDAVQLPPAGVYSTTTANSSDSSGSQGSSSKSYIGTLADGDKYWDGYSVYDKNVFNVDASQSYGSTGQVINGTGDNDFIYVNQLVSDSGQPLDYRIDAGGESSGLRQKDRVILPGQEGDYTKTTWADENHVVWTKYTHNDTGTTIEVRNTESVEFRGYYGSPPAENADGTDLSKYAGKFSAGDTSHRGWVNSDSVVLDSGNTTASTGKGKDLIVITELITVDGNGKATPITYEADGGDSRVLNDDTLRLIGPESDWKTTENVNHDGSVWNEAVNSKTGTTVFYKNIEHIEYSNSDYSRA